jgi:hypothetical protein
MSIGTIALVPRPLPPIREPATRSVLWAVAAALAFVLLTRWPVARSGPLEWDEVNDLETSRVFRFPMHHTLFLAAARGLGAVVGDRYLGFVVLDMAVSALALTAVWWWLRALVRPATAAAATLVLAVGPVFWAYGAMAGNYTAIPLVGAFLLGIAVRTAREPQPWHPHAAAVALALGTGYRQDIGPFWLPVFLIIVWRHRWLAAVQALALFTAVSLAWLVVMLRDIGGWGYFREASAEFAYSAGYQNSVWHLGIIDAPIRYAVKLGVALLWTLGPGLAFVPRGIGRLGQRGDRSFLAPLLAASVLPALGSHLLIHFGVPGYALHDVPALIALMALGIGRCPATRDGCDDGSPARLAALAGLLAAVFWFYPTDYDRPGVRGSFDLAFARQTRIGLRTVPPARAPEHWRTRNSPRALGPDAVNLRRAEMAPAPE